MLKKLMTLGSLACVLSFSSIGHAQALPTATGRGGLQAGGGYSVASSDYGQGKIQGFSGFADFDFTNHLGVEADIHYIAIITPNDLAENTYLIGPRYVFRRNRYNIYGKGLLGIGDMVIQEVQDNQGTVAGTSFAYALGGGVDFMATKHIVVRAIDFEYQHWNYGAHGLTPMVFTVGAAYRFR